MPNTLEFPVLLRLIDERSAALRDAAASAPDLEATVPTCPEWTLLDLVRHLGAGQRRWAATVEAAPDSAGPAAMPGSDEAEAAPEEREALLAWSAESTRHLLDALREAGPERDCWTWWGDSQSPQTTGAVARHQVQEAMVHAHDAQIASGAPQTPPREGALDGVEEFLSTCCATTAPWPHDAAVLDFHAAEGRSWRLSLSAEGARVTALPAPGTAPAGDESRRAADASAQGSAAELVLVFYGRNPIESLRVEGDERLLHLLSDWDPDA